MTNIIYENHFDDTGEILTEAEWLLNEKRYSGKLRKFESYWDGLKRYGIVGVAAYIAGTVAATASSGLLTVPLSLILYAGYRKYSDTCSKQCEGRKLCLNKCYLQATIPVIKEINSEITAVKNSKSINPEEKKKVLEKLDKELIKWVKRYNHYNQKVKDRTRDKEEKRKRLASDSAKEMARYYGNNLVDESDDE